MQSLKHRGMTDWWGLHPWDAASPGWVLQAAVWAVPFFSVGLGLTTADWEPESRQRPPG